MYPSVSGRYGQMLVILPQKEVCETPAGESLDTWASRATPAKCVVYGATELLTGEAFTSQLAELGRRSGAT